MIMGDVGTGKTKLTRRLLEEAAKMESIITVLDFAPPMRVCGSRVIGGFLFEGDLPGVIHYKSEEIKTPRLSAENPDELLNLADHNREITEGMLMEYIGDPSKALFINDASIHLQRGEFGDLMKAVEMAETAVINGYMGSYLRADLGTGISEREERLMKRLGEMMDRVIHLG
jgi:hypothetical protein